MFVLEIQAYSDTYDSSENDRDHDPIIFTDSIFFYDNNIFVGVCFNS